MKTIKLAITALVIALLAFASCKKDKNEPINTTVTTEDLLNYQIYWGLVTPDATVNIRVLYLEK